MEAKPGLQSSKTVDESLAILAEVLVKAGHAVNTLNMKQLADQHVVIAPGLCPSMWTDIRVFAGLPLPWEEVQRGIKIVRGEDGSLLSGFEVERPVHYSMSQWSIPPPGCGPLAVFPDNRPDAAKEFFDFLRKRHTDAHFFTCSYVPVPPIHARVLWTGTRYNYGVRGTDYALKVKLEEEWQR